ncbi:MAG: hypothetical protein OEY01_03585 [Desulfobulbaceae bacterium]|nr:hypothetical protein [Desulfobulbaceae bacterium]
MTKIKSREELLRESRLFTELTDSVKKFYYTNGHGGLTPVYYHRKNTQTSEILDLFRKDLDESGLTEVTFEVIEVQVVAGSPGFKVIFTQEEPVEEEEPVDPAPFDLIKILDISNHHITSSDHDKLLDIKAMGLNASNFFAVHSRTGWWTLYTLHEDPEWQVVCEFWEKRGMSTGFFQVLKLARQLEVDEVWIHPYGPEYCVPELSLFEW